jgi:CRISPR-associated protein Cas1
MTAAVKHQGTHAIRRVLQRAALDVLTAPIDATFLPASYGCRPGRSLHDAVRRIVARRKRGLRWVVDADIAECFPKPDRARLMEFVRPLVPDPELTRLIDLWIGSQAGPTAGKGISLGAPISPLLCNVYLHQLDASLTRRRLELVRYADDFVVLRGSQARAEWALHTTEKVMAGLDLALNPKKTRIVSFDEGFDFLGVHFEGDRVSFDSDGKRVVIEGVLPPISLDLPDGYR